MAFILDSDEIKAVGSVCSLPGFASSGTKAVDRGVSVHGLWGAWLDFPGTLEGWRALALALCLLPSGGIICVFTWMVAVMVAFIITAVSLARSDNRVSACPIQRGASFLQERGLAFLLSAEPPSAGVDVPGWCMAVIVRDFGSPSNFRIRLLLSCHLWHIWWILTISDMFHNCQNLIEVVFLKKNYQKEKQRGSFTTLFFSACAPNCFLWGAQPII